MWCEGVRSHTVWEGSKERVEGKDRTSPSCLASGPFPPLLLYLPAPLLLLFRIPARHMTIYSKVSKLLQPQQQSRPSAPLHVLPLHGTGSALNLSWCFLSAHPGPPQFMMTHTLSAKDLLCSDTFSLLVYLNSRHRFCSMSSALVSPYKGPQPLHLTLFLPLHLGPATKKSHDGQNW